MTEKILRFRWLIIAVMVLAFAPKTVQAQTTVTLEPPSSGDGTKDDPYQIASMGNLYWFAALVNGKLTDGTQQNAAACAKLMNHITVNENLFTEKINEGGGIKDGQTVYNWTPIGTSYSNRYTGTFDGQGHTISGLYFKKDAIQSDAYIGLFGRLSGTVKNVGVEDSYFNATIVAQSEDMDWKLYIGGVCGYNKGTITNCYNTGKISGTERSADVGGVCGYNYEGEITYCYNTGTVSGTGSNANVGGVCGYNHGNNAKITNCHNSGMVSGTESADIGGVCGCNSETIKNCYYLKDENDSPKDIGHSYSYVTEDKIEGKSLTEFGNGSVAWLLNENATDGSTTPEKTSHWLQNLSTDGGDKYPVLKANTANGVCPIVKIAHIGYENDNSHSYSELATNADAGIHNLYSYHCTKCNADNKKVIKNLTKDNDAAIEIIKNGTEPWKTTSLINLTAATYYDAPVEFTTTGGVTFKFTRTADVKWATLCLPYKITTSNYTDKCKFYKLNSVGENEIVLGELSGEIAAGIPVFVKSDNGFNVDFNIPENTEIEMTTGPKDQSATGGTLIGTFKEKTLTTDANANDLFIKENFMWSVKQTGKDKMIVRPFRAYIVPTTSNGAPKRSITIDGEATAISDALDTLNDTNAEYYDMSGRRISSLQKGVNIIRSGNKTRKVIIK